MEYTFRNMEISDKNIVVPFLEKIWEGDDYIPSKFDKWVNEANGCFTAILYNDQIIGCGKLTFLTKNDIWFEGLRKDPEFKGKGVGKQLLKHYLDKISDYDNIKTIRFATYFENVESITLTTKAGFIKDFDASLKIYEVECQKNKNILSIDESYNKIREKNKDLLWLKDAEKVYNYIVKTNYSKEINHVLIKDWVCYPFERIDKQEFTKYCFVSGNIDNIDALILFDINKEKKLISIMHFTYRKYVKAEKLYKSFYEFIYNLFKCNYELEIIIPSKQSEVLNFFNKKGFQSWERENDFVMYKYPIEKLIN